MPKYRDLLGALQEIEDLLLVTHTIREEVERNRVAVYRDHNKLQPFSHKFSLLELRSHHNEDTSDVEEINKQVRQLQNSLARDSDELFKKLENAYKNNLLSIIRGEDDLSQVLDPLFEKAVLETSEQLERARIRKERGRPPGKRTDLLGDQISWEQLLDAARDKGSVWIITKDKDYTEGIAGTLYLKPLLHRELMGTQGVKDIRCFSDLASFFKAFREAGAVREEQLPSAATVEEAQEEIRSETVTPPPPTSIRRMSDIDIAVHNREVVWPPTCNKSPTGQHRVPGTTPRPSGIYGGWTYQGPCLNCGVVVDTGDPYDD
jgi:hypothetical protein